MIVHHQRESTSNRGFRYLARCIGGRDTKPRATWFLAAKLPGVSGADDLELACKLVDAVQAQNTHAGSKRTYHLVISLHPEDRCLERDELQQIVDRLVDALGFSEHQYIAVRHSDTDHEHIRVAINKIHPETLRIHSPAWDYQKLFTGARALELELGLTPLRSRTRERENVPQRAADCEAHHGVDSFARWARKTLRPALPATELRSWDDVHDLCGRFGVVIRPHGNGLVFEEVERGVRVKRINQLRWACQCLPPLTHWKGGEQCARKHAKYDSKRGIHGGFNKGICKPKELAQNECPGWPSKSGIIEGCLQAMWDEGPGKRFSKHGHYMNMSNPSYERVACGFAKSADGEIWSGQNFR